MDEENMEHDILQDIFDGIIKPTDVKFSALQRITRNFSKEQIIGKGGFATVYKGVLRNGEVAVKRITNDKTIYDEQFQQEVTSLLKVSHKNIVRFIGFCSHTVHKAVHYKGQYVYAENRDRLLCFEYINNGSLEKYITDELRGLQWDTRYSIIKGICEGLQYLHEEVGIIHRDLKPANILIHDKTVAKITDFGLARMKENAQTTTGISTRGYTPPEYIDNCETSVKYDVYSLGIIIIELVTGSRSIPDSNNVLRRWRHRLRKGKETTYICQQIAKLIEIGLRCQEKEPYKRPFINEIISDIKALENSKANKSTLGKISPYSEDDMLGIDPLELRFPFKLNSSISCSFELTNETNAFIAFSVHTTSPLSYCIQPNKDIVPPRSKYSVNITLQPLDNAPQDMDTGSFVVCSTKVKESLIHEDIKEEIFSREDGKLVDEVNLTITYKVPQVDVSFESLKISDTTNLHGTQESSVPPTEAESKISASTSDEVIQFDPSKLCFPLVPDKKVFSAIKIINVTESYVSYILSRSAYADTATYIWKVFDSVLPPRSTEYLRVTREGTEDAVNDIEFSDEMEVRYAIVDANMKACDLDPRDHSEMKKLPIVLDKVNSCTSNELIQFDPPELCFPCQNKTSFSSVNIVNITDCYVGFTTWWFEKIDADYEVIPSEGILPPRFTQRMVVKRVPKKNKSKYVEVKDNIFVWNMIVAEGVDASSLLNLNDDEESKEIPFFFQKISPCSSDELIRVDQPGLHFTFSQNKTSLCSVNMVNITDYFVGFRLFNSDKAAGASYHIDTEVGILAPRSTQRLVVARPTKEKKPEDTQYNTLFMWNAIVSEGIKVSDLDSDMSLSREQSNELPIILNKITSSSSKIKTPSTSVSRQTEKGKKRSSSSTSLSGKKEIKAPSTSVELIKFEPHELRFPFLPIKRLLSSIKIVNITNCHIGFNTHVEETNAALYITEPPCGVLPPRSTQEVVVTRVAKEEIPELEDMQYKDKYFVSSCFVTEDVNASDLGAWIPITERKELPIVFTEESSNELIHFDPPEIRLPPLPNQRVLSSIKIVNITDQYIGFKICNHKSNLGRYDVNPSEGILPPMSTQVLLITRIAREKGLEDTQCKEMFFVWNGIVTEDVKASDVIDNMSEANCTELPIVLTKETSSSISDELIQFDPLELHFPFLQNKKVSTSIKMVNLTDYDVGFNTYSRPTNAAWYHTEPPRGILPPRSTQKLIVTMGGKEDVLEDKKFNDKYFVWRSIVAEGVKDTDITDCMADQESKELPVVLDKISSSTSDELIQLDPTELCMPHFPNKQMEFLVNVVNTTDFYVAFIVYTITRNAARYKIPRHLGILPPRSTKRCILCWIDDPEHLEDYFVWNRVVSEGVESVDIIGCMANEESKKLPFTMLNKASPCTSNELIQFDPPELSLPFMPNKSLVFTVNIINSTDYCVGFARYHPRTNVGMYYIIPAGGVMPPRSTQRLLVVRVPGKKEDMQCEDKFHVWSSLVSEGVEASDFFDHVYYTGSKELPIVYKTSICTSGELIQFDSPRLTFPFLPNKRVSILNKFKIINVTDHNVGFNIWIHPDNSAWYSLEPSTGILPPQSTQAIKVRRTLKENAMDDMQCKDRILVWYGILTEDVQLSDIQEFWGNKDVNKELTVVLTKPGESSSRQDRIGQTSLRRKGSRRKQENGHGKN